jgi:hypothetical protein
MWNVRNEMVAYSQTRREKGRNRSISGGASAAIDLTIALEALTVKLAGSQSVWAAGRKTIFTISDAFAKRALGTTSEYLIKEFSGRLLGQIAGGLIFAAINLSDAWDAYQVGDNVMWGHLLMAASGVVGAIGSVIVVAGGATFLGLGPVAWVTLILLGSGIAITAWLTKKPMEDWLRMGPFAEPDNAAVHLQDPKQALYRLVSMLADIRIAILPNPAYEVNAKVGTSETTSIYVRESETLIRIESNVPGLMKDFGVSGIYAEVMQEKTSVFYDVWRVGANLEKKALMGVETPEAYRIKTDAMELFVKAGIRTGVQQPPDTKLLALRTRYLVRAQITITDGNALWVFPAPPPKDSTTFGPAYAKANFLEVDQLFWADETAHKAPVRS